MINEIIPEATNGNLFLQGYEFWKCSWRFKIDVELQPGETKDIFFSLGVMYPRGIRRKR